MYVCMSLKHSDNGRVPESPEAGSLSGEVRNLGRTVDSVYGIECLSRPRVAKHVVGSWLLVNRNSHHHALYFVFRIGI